MIVLEVLPWLANVVQKKERAAPSLRGHFEAKRAPASSLFDVNPLFLPLEYNPCTAIPEDTPSCYLIAYRKRLNPLKDVVLRAGTRTSSVPAFAVRTSSKSVQPSATSEVFL